MRKAACSARHVTSTQQPSFHLISDPNSTPPSPSLRWLRPCDPGPFYSPLQPQPIDSTFRSKHKRRGTSALQATAPWLMQQPLCLSSHSAWGSQANHSKAQLCAPLHCTIVKGRQNTTYTAKCQSSIILQVQKGRCQHFERQKFWDVECLLGDNSRVKELGLNPGSAI